MVSRNGDSISLALGITGGIIALISLILCCTGIGLPTWYVDTNANNTVIVAEANLFYSCYAQNASQATTSSTFKCASYSSYICSTTSYQNSVLNVTTYLPGCTNPNSDSVVYLNFNGPIYQTTTNSFYNLRTAAILSIISILFTFASAIFGFVTGIITMNIYLALIGPIVACFAVIFGICCLVVAGGVFNITGSGSALFVAGLILELIVVPILSIMAGRLNNIQGRKYTEENEAILTQRSGSTPIIVRRVHKRRV
jgi:hypothetical protein